MELCPLIWVIIIDTLLVTPLITIYEPQSTLALSNPSSTSECPKKLLAGLPGFGLRVALRVYLGIPKPTVLRVVPELGVITYYFVGFGNTDRNH